MRIAKHAVVSIEYTLTGPDGKVKPATAVVAGGLGMSSRKPSAATSASPKPIAASQCQAAMRRRRHISHANTSTEAGVSTCQSPSAASIAIR